MKKNLLFIAIIALFLETSYAQDFKYEDIVDDPEHMTFAQIGLGIWDMNLNGFNMQIWNLNPRIYFQTSKLFSIEAEGSKAMLDRFYPSPADALFSDGMSSPVILKSKYKSTPAININFTGTWYFSSRLKEEEVTHTLSEKGNVSYVSTLPTKVLYSKGLRLGYTAGSTHYTLGKSIASELQRTDMSGQIDDISVNDGNASTTIEYSYFKVGFSSTEIIKKIIQTDKYGKKDYSVSTAWYFDFFIPQKYEADDMYYNNFNGSSSGYQLELYPVTINYKKKLPLGGCFGVKAENVSGHGIGIGVEGGVMPGFIGDIIGTLYGRVNFSYQFAYLFSH